MVGHASVMAGTLTWSPAAHSETTRKIVISVTPRRGQTVIRIQESLEILGIKKAIFPLGGLMGMALGSAIAMGLGMGEPEGPLFGMVVAVFGMIAAARTVTSIQAGDRGPQLHGLARTMAEIGAEAQEKKLGPG
jgi:hypothetical protein